MLAFCKNVGGSACQDPVESITHVESIRQHELDNHGRTRLESEKCNSHSHMHAHPRGTMRRRRVLSCTTVAGENERIQSTALGRLRTAGHGSVGIGTGSGPDLARHVIWLIDGVVILVSGQQRLQGVVRSVSGFQRISMRHGHPTRRVRGTHFEHVTARPTQPEPLPRQAGLFQRGARARTTSCTVDAAPGRQTYNFQHVTPRAGHKEPSGRTDR